MRKLVTEVELLLTKAKRSDRNDTKSGPMRIKYKWLTAATLMKGQVGKIKRLSITEVVGLDPKNPKLGMAFASIDGELEVVLLRPTKYERTSLADLGIVPGKVMPQDQLWEVCGVITAADDIPYVAKDTWSIQPAER